MVRALIVKLLFSDGYSKVIPVYSRSWEAGYTDLR